MTLEDITQKGNVTRKGKNDLSWKAIPQPPTDPRTVPVSWISLGSIIPMEIEWKNVKTYTFYEYHYILCKWFKNRLSRTPNGNDLL